MPTFAAPHFLILIPLLIIVGWYFRGLKLWRPLRLLICLLLVLLLAEPAILRKQRGMDLWVLIDRSESARDIVDRDADEWKDLIERQRPGKHDRVKFVDYADEVVTNTTGETAVYPGNRNLTRTSLAIQDVLARVDPERHSRLLLFSDGYSTEPLTGVAEKLIAMEVPLDYRQLRGEEEIDYRIASLEMPARVQLGEPFIIELAVLGATNAIVPLELFRDGKKILETKVNVENGIGRIKLTDRSVSASSFRYEARILPEQDTFAGNNTFEGWIEVVAGPKILLITNYDDDPMVNALQRQGFRVQVEKESLGLNPGMLSGAKAVIINNVPAYEMPNPFLDALDFFVRDQGGGLMMAGGKYSFGSGGYHDSAIDPLLPVTMELKSEHRKLAVAMAIVMDRSGSMSMTVNSGHTKIQLANEGAARAVELLGNRDAVAVYAVDSSAHQICPLLNVGKHRNELNSRIRKIQSMGGGIYVYNGLKAAWAELEKSKLGQRHIILFTDAADSEQPGGYKELIKKMVAENTTVSVIGLGDRSDPDAAFIEDVAKRGNGRIFFTKLAGDLPNIFAQETVTVARSTFITDPVGTQPTGNWYEVANRDLEWLKEVDGYNLSYVREGDRAALISTDDYNAPLVAFGRRGIGRSAAVSFPLGGEFSERPRNWEKAGDFMQTLNRWLMGDEIPPGIGLRHELKGTELSIDLLFDTEQWQKRFAQKPPQIVLSRGAQNPERAELTWERIAPGHYSLKTNLREGELIRGAAKVGKHAIPFGPVVVGSSREWAFDVERVNEMKETAETSGGRDLVDLKNAWLKPEGRELATFQAWLLIPLLVLFLFEALVTRTGWKMPTFFSKKAKGKKPKRKKVAKKNKAKSQPEATEEAAPPESPEPVSEQVPKPQEATKKVDRQSRFNRAKRKK